MLICAPRAKYLAVMDCGRDPKTVVGGVVGASGKAGWSASICDTSQRRDGRPKRRSHAASRKARRERSARRRGRQRSGARCGSATWSGRGCDNAPAGPLGETPLATRFILSKPSTSIARRSGSRAPTRHSRAGACRLRSGVCCRRLVSDGARHCGWSKTAEVNGGWSLGA
jgi:hypothetical protein